MNSIVHAVLNNSEAFPDKNALIFDGEEITYSQFAEKITVFAAALKSKGIKKGSRIALEADDLISFFAAFLGCQLAGCIAVPIEKDISIYKLQNILKITKPALVFLKNNGENFESFVSDEKPPEKIKYPKPDSVAAIISTTGTTGQPVMVTHTNKSMFSTSRNLAGGTNITADTVLFSNIPFDLAVGFRRVFAALCEGATCVITNNRLSEELLSECFEKYNINYITLINVNINFLIDISDKELQKAIGNIKCVESVSGPLTPVNMRNFHKKYPNVTLYNVYGATESGCVIINNTSENSIEGCLGKPACNAEIFIIDENGNRVNEPGRYGYIAIKGDMNMVGYYRKKALTEEVMPDDYIVLNDIAYFDEEGYYYFVSRVGEIIDVNGHKIILTEIEKVIKEFDGIIDCACVAEDDFRYGQIPILYIVCSKKDFDFEGLEQYMKKRLEYYKIPQKIIPIEKIPRTSTGKVIRKPLSMIKYF